MTSFLTRRVNDNNSVALVEFEMLSVAIFRKKNILKDNVFSHLETTAYVVFVCFRL